MSDELTMEDLARRGEEAIAHFGVKGMQWGVRTKTNGGGQVSAKAAVAGHIAKKAVVIGAKTGLIGVLGVVGVPVAVSSAVTVAMNPELISMGKEMAKLKLDDLGIVDMSSIERLKSMASVDKDALTISARETVRGRS